MINTIRHRLLYTFFLTLVVAGATFCLASPARAAFNNNRVMDDGVFDNSTTMDEASIQSFLNSFPNSCLKNYQAPYPNDYFNYGGNVPAARVIKRAADLWGINPQVILATLEKEESLVRGNAGCADWRYNSAMGMGCPDGGSCPSPAYAGFSKQVTKGSWQLKYNKERSYGNTGWGDNDSLTYYGYMTQGNRKRCGSCSNIYYDGWASIDSTSVHMDTGATASLYTYTPHFHGNQNFVALFEAWFGSTWGNGSPPPEYFIDDVSGIGFDMNFDTTVNIVATVRNNTSATWYSDINLPVGQQPTRLITHSYSDALYANPGDANWLGTRNQIRMQTQTVLPGETGTFIISLHSPYFYTSRYKTTFYVSNAGIVLRGSPLEFYTSNYPPYYSVISATNPTANLAPNQTSTGSIAIRNLSGTTWYSDNNLPAGKQPVRLASIGYTDSPFANNADSNWMGTRSQVKMTPDVVAPGQDATFTMPFIGPLHSSNQAFRFIPIIAGQFMHDAGMAFPLSTSANLSYQGVSATNPPSTMSPGQVANVSLTIKNTGNAYWRDEAFSNGSKSLRLAMINPLYRSSAFYDASDSSWLVASQIAKPTGTTAPGENVTFTFNWKAPSTSGRYIERFAPILDGVLLQDIGMAFVVDVQ